MEMATWSSTPIRRLVEQVESIVWTKSVDSNSSFLPPNLNAVVWLRTTMACNTYKQIAKIASCLVSNVNTISVLALVIVTRSTSFGWKKTKITTWVCVCDWFDVWSRDSIIEQLVITTWIRRQTGVCPIWRFGMDYGQTSTTSSDWGNASASIRHRLCRTRTSFPCNMKTSRMFTTPITGLVSLCCLSCSPFIVGLSSSQWNSVPAAIRFPLHKGWCRFWWKLLHVPCPRRYQHFNIQPHEQSTSLHGKQVFI